MIKNIVRRCVPVLPNVLFLRALPGNKRITFVDPPQKKSRSEFLLWKTLWTIAERGRVRTPVYKTVQYRTGEHEFSMRLDISTAPECGYYYKYPEPSLTRMIAKGGRTFLDIGANVGFHSLTASGFFEKVYAFEPTPDTFGRLSQNAALSGASNLTPVDTAIYSETGTTTFHVSRSHCGGNSIKNDKNHADATVPITIKTQTLDEFVAERDVRDIDLIKIDVEGAEPDVLRGGLKTIEKNFPLLFVELLDNTVAKQVREILPDAYKMWNHHTGTALSMEEFSNVNARPRDVVFAVNNPF